MSAGSLCRAIKVYWKTLFILIYPSTLLPVFLFNNTPAWRCLYVILVMAGFWVFEVIPLPITSLFPLALFPIMGILDSDKVCACYFKEANMVFVGGMMIAIAIEYCNLHSRVALYVIKVVGCGPRRLNIGLFLVTAFISMWISNTAATALMIPIVQATLEELERQGIGKMYEKDDIEATPDPEFRKPTKQTMCYYISTAYAATIGGTGCLIGTGTNLTLMGQFETLFPDSPGVEFTRWLMLNIPIMVAIMILVIIWLQTYYMGLFRPNSVDAQNVNIGKEGKEVAKGLINKKIEELGPMSFHEISVGMCFVLAILLWFFRKPQFIPGWAELITDTKVKDATPAMIVVLILFVLPAHADFIYMFSKDETKRPVTGAPSLITWKIVNEKMHWGLIFLLGGGFALAEGSKASGMNTLIAEYLRGFASMPKLHVMILSCLMTTVLNQLITSNVAMANIILPVLGEMAILAKIHPMYIMMPATLCCSYAYCLPASTPPNAIATAPINMPTSKVIIGGTGTAILSMGALFVIFPFYGPVVYEGLDTFPDWAVQEKPAQ